ncbi:MAG: putative molybdenum carrier protein [Candidatus Riflebacteria bacterium]|nr:putative molybdenum carrier protein [Candidatus Riflebacteria bacterium]
MSSRKFVKEKFGLEKIISGGQTGVDRFALDAAMEAGISVGGWCPLGRRSEDGTIPEKYPLIETDSKNYPVRTFMNVRDSDATLIFSAGEPSGGTAMTVEFAVRENKPFLIIDSTFYEPEGASEHLHAWLIKIKPCVLNVAGPRLSQAPDVAAFAKIVIKSLLR